LVFRAAECTSLRQLRGEHRFVRHEMLKAQNSLVMMVLKMCGTGIFVRKHAVSSPQVRARRQLCRNFWTKLPLLAASARQQPDDGNMSHILGRQTHCLRPCRHASCPAVLRAHRCSFSHDSASTGVHAEET
jgi:hypothetical protein